MYELYHVLLIEYFLDLERLELRYKIYCFQNCFGYLLIEQK